jgi:uncharacterized protein (TIGR03790 family)
LSILAHAQGPGNVLLVVNTTSPVSRTVGDYYRQKRGIPGSNVCEIAAPVAEGIARADFERLIQTPVAQCLASRRLQDQVLYIVLAKGVPLRIEGRGGGDGDMASVDSELTMLYEVLLGVSYPVKGKVPNPYFVVNRKTPRFARFSHRGFGMYLVTRLDGYDANGVKAMIDRGLAPGKNGRFVLDLREKDETMGNAWLREAAARLRAVGVQPEQVLLETSGKFLTGQQKVLGYASWGANDPANQSRFLQHQWENGAILVEFVSTNARTFERPPAAWNIASWKEKNKYFAGSPQSLIADYLEEGATGAAGAVAEPFLDAVPWPHMLFPAYASGLNLAESYYAAMPFLSWQMVVVGDPLVAPFSRPPLPAAEARPPLDPALGLPRYFAQRRVVLHAKATGAPPALSHRVLAAERAAAAGNQAQAQRIADEALAKYPESIVAMNLVAGLNPDSTRAVALYRKVVELQPNNALALNNLAYVLATRGGQPQEALPYAARAADMAQGKSAEILDTYGWIHYLLGNPQEARVHLEKAAALRPGSAVLAYHLGATLLKLGRTAEGRRYLERALTLEPDGSTAAAIRKELGR